MARILICGAGIGGFRCALNLEKLVKDEIVLIDKNPMHTFVPSIHKIICGSTSPEKIQIDLRKKLSKRRIEFLQEKIEDFDVKNRIVMTENEKITYDYLVLSLGSETYFPNLELKNKVLEFKSVEDAIKIREKVLNLMNSEDKKIITVVGGGTTGIELLFKIMDLLTSHGNNKPKAILRIIHSRDRLAPYLNEKMSKKIEEEMVRNGIEILKSKRVVDVKDNEIVLKDGRLNSDLTIWTAGVRPNSIINKIDLEKKPSGIVVDRYLRSISNRKIYAIGDFAEFENEVKIKRAYHALKEAEIAAKNISRDLKGKNLIPYEQKEGPQLISLGCKKAILGFNNFIWKGRIPALMHKYGVEKRYLMKLYFM